jgi:serine/threonine protein kinase
MVEPTNKEEEKSVSPNTSRRTVENKDRKFSDFKIIKIIGTGTFGKVYLALIDEKPIALKALKKT